MKNKNSKARMQVIFGTLLFTLVFMIELYGMINYPDMFIILAVIAGVDLIFLFVIIEGLMELSDQKKARQEEQYDSVFKSEKASYLMLKKYFEEIEDKLNYLEQASKIPTEEIVNAQKGIAKVIINRNHENSDALMNAYDQLLEEVGQLREELGATEDIAKNHTEEILTAQKSRGEETEKEIQIKIQDLMVSLKDMELRLNSAIMQSQKVVAQMPMMSAPVPKYSQQPPVQVMEPKENSKEPLKQENMVSEPNVEELKSEPVTEQADEALKPEPMSEIESEEATIPEPEVTPAAEPEIAKKPESEAAPVPEPEVTVAPSEEKPPMPDLSDPNKTMSPDEIAALFANMGEASEPEKNAEQAEEPKLEVVHEPVLENPEPEVTAAPAEEEKPPMPDLSDPNKTLSPDEIAALFANMGA